MRSKVLILGIFLSLSVFLGAADMVKMVYGGYLGESKEDIVKFKDIYTKKEEKEKLLKEGRVFYLPAETLLEKRLENFGRYQEFVYDGRSVYALNLSTQTVIYN